MYFDTYDDIIILLKLANVKSDREVIKMIYGYCRISTAKQNIDRQERNILASFPKAKIVKETYTGTKFQGRKELEKIVSKIKSGDTIVFDSVSRMSRDANEGIELYFSLYEKGVNLVFLKEGYINTDIYKESINQTLDSTGNEIADIYISATNKVIRLLAEKQIAKAFEQAEKEVNDLHVRTAEGIETARRNGKQIGQKQGNKLVVKKAIKSKEEIKKYNKDFGGTLNDKETMKLIGIANNTYYKYKKELKEAAEQ